MLELKLHNTGRFMTFTVLKETIRRGFLYPTSTSMYDQYLYTSDYILEHINLVGKG